MVASDRNPWPTRLAIAGAVLLLLGVFVMNSQGDAINEAYDARQVATMTTTGPEMTSGPLEEGCYYAVTIDGANNVDVNLTEIEGSALSDAPLEQKICASDWTPMSTDGTIFIITSGWIVDEGAEYAMETTCQGDADCINESVYLVHTNLYQYAVFDSMGFVIGFASCCSGLLLLPLAGVVLWLSRTNKQATSVVMMNPDGTMSPATEITPEMMAAFARGENPLQQRVESPFADTGLVDAKQDAPEDFIDGKQSVMSGNLLTTEQVYALMRGDVEQATQQVPDPFQRSSNEPGPTKAAGPIKNPNTKTIASWDEGGPLTSESTPTKSERKTVQPLKKVDDKNQSNNDWKSWDEI